MSQHMRCLERENVNPQPNKAVLHPSKSKCNANRLALGEVGNKIHNTAAQNDCKVKELKPRAAVIVKKQLTVAEKVATKVTNNKKTNKAITTSEAAGSNNAEKKTSTKQRLPDFVSGKVPLSYSTKQLAQIIDVDTSDDPLHVSEYIQDIYKYLLELESRFNIDKHFLDDHKVTPRMRMVLVNWMVQVHVNFKLLLETFHLSVAIVDRYLQLNKQVGKDTLQLVGTAALWIAGKYEDIYIPELSDFVYICDNAFTSKQFTEMECEILKKLDFNLGRPLSLQFLRRFSKIAQVNFDQHTLGKYLLELGLLDCELCHIKPSLQAAAACCLSISILEDLPDPSHAWSDTLVHYSSYLYKDIKPVIVLMACVLKKEQTTKYKSIYNKYSDVKHSKISLHSKLKGRLVDKLTAQSCVSNKK